MCGSWPKPLRTPGYGYEPHNFLSYGGQTNMVKVKNNPNDPDFLSNIFRKNASAFSHLISASQNYLSAMSKYANDFMIPYLIATSYFNDVEKQKLWSNTPLETVQSYMQLLTFNLDLVGKGISGSMQAIASSGKMEMENAIAAMFNSLFLCRW